MAYELISISTSTSIRDKKFGFSRRSRIHTYAHSFQLLYFFFHFFLIFLPPLRLLFFWSVSRFFLWFLSLFSCEASISPIPLLSGATFVTLARPSVFIFLVVFIPGVMDIASPCICFFSFPRPWIYHLTFQVTDWIGLGWVLVTWSDSIQSNPIQMDWFISRVFYLSIQPTVSESVLFFFLDISRASATVFELRSFLLVYLLFVFYVPLFYFCLCVFVFWVFIGLVFFCPCIVFFFFRIQRNSDLVGDSLIDLWFFGLVFLNVVAVMIL